MRKITDEELKKSIDKEKYPETRQQYVSRMEKEGFEIVTPNSTELFIDIDSKTDFNRFNIAFGRLKQEYAPVTAISTFSKKGDPHRHIIVTLPFEITSMQRIALQAVLGSDLTREMLSIFRCFGGDPVPTLFAERIKKGNDK